MSKISNKNWLKRHFVGLSIGIVFSALAILVTALLINDETYEAHLSLEKIAITQFASLEQEVKINLEEVQSLQFLYHTLENVSREQFRTFVSPKLEELKSIQALEWIPKVTHEKRTEFEEKAIAEGYSGFQIIHPNAKGERVKAAEREVYYPVYFLEPLKGNEDAFGFDLGYDPKRLEALDQSKATKSLVATQKIRLIQEKAHQNGFLVLAPVFSNKNTRSGEIKGFVLGVYRIGELMATALHDWDGDIDFYLQDITDPSKTEHLHTISNDTLFVRDNNQVNGADLSGKLKIASKKINVGQRNWEISAYTDPSTIRITFLPWLVLSMGLLISFLTTLIFINQKNTSLEFESKVNEATGELKATLNKLEHSNEKLETINKDLKQFVYIASHDLQEPLRTVKSFVELLQKDYQEQLDKKGNKSIGFIVQSTNRMSLLVKGLLDHSRLGKDKNLTIVDCNSILKAVIADMAINIEENNASIEIGILPELEGYATELHLLFQNLINNAIKFRRKQVSPHIKVGAEKDNGYWKFSFADNGIGIEEKHKEKIFTIFRRLHLKTKYEGTGIGLAHCKKIVELHGGKIWVESKLNEGSIFYFTIPEKLSLNDLFIS